MAKNFGKAEHRVLSLFQVGETFTFENQQYRVVNSGKPSSIKGEPKTDIYIAAMTEGRNIKEFKISFKKSNADFLENKTNADRAEQLLGELWSSQIIEATLNLKNEFLSRPLIYKDKFGRTDKGAITLGWKFELLNVKSGQLSDSMYLSKRQIIDVYSGTNLNNDKKHASVNGVIIPESGIANYILFEDKEILTVQDAVDSLLTINEYVEKHPEIYFACKALNYRSFKKKYDGNRPLAVYVRWFATQGKLDYELIFDNPLQNGGDYAYNQLRTAMETLGISTTDDIDESKVINSNIIYEK